MKKVIFYAASLVSMTVLAQNLSTSLVSQYRDNNGVPLKNDSTQKSSQYFQSCILTTFAYNNVRALTELNNANQAEAFPWISSDGLRLYYTSSANNDELMFTQRNNTSSFFASPTIVPIAILNAYSYWLSINELDIYVTNGNNLYYAHRNTVTSAFDTPVPINLSGITLSTIAGASLNLAQNELFIYNTDGNKSILEFSRTSPTAFTYTRTLPLPSGYSPNPGQLSKDELTFFLGANYNGGKSLLYQLTRATPFDTFTVGTFQQIQGINDTTLTNTHPSMSDSLNWVAFARASSDSWYKCDLYIAHKGITTSVFDPNEIRFSVSVFPNPTNQELFIDLSDYKNTTVDIFNIEGNLLQKVALQSSRTTVSTDNLTTGIYLIKIKNTKEIIVKKIIKN